MRRIPPSEGEENWDAEGIIEPIKRLDKDLKAAASHLAPIEVRYLVGLYYQMQEQRIRAAAQKRKTLERGEPNALISWMTDNYATLEGDIKRAMQVYALSRPEGKWMADIIGIGPVLSAGLLAHIDIELSPSPSHIWSFAGVNPQVRWLGPVESERLVNSLVGSRTPLILDDVIQVARETNRQPGSLWRLARVKLPEGYDATKVPRSALISALARRPWNAKLKVLTWKVGQSFVKSCNHPRSFYGPLYKQRKAYELANNNMRQVQDAVPTRYEQIVAGQPGMYADQARNALSRKRYGEETDARRWYEMGMLPPAHIQQRVERWTAKLFLSHLWWVMYETRYGSVPPRPYIIEHGGHTHVIDPPNWPKVA